MNKISCFHCGDECTLETIVTDEKNFCCNGCKTVYEIFSENDLTYFYELETAAGTSPEDQHFKYDFLDDEKLASKLLEFNDGSHKIINLYIPQIHCSSCIWVLENLGKLTDAVLSSQVDFPKKTVRIGFNGEQISLKKLVLLLSKIGYAPYISLEDIDGKKKKTDNSLLYKLAVAGFAFGNVMFLSFPEYFQEQEFWLDRYKHLFRWLMLIFSLPVVFYSGRDYLISGYKSLRSKMLNIDVPIALGILTLFVRSTVEIVFDLGTGFFDSLTGLVFFLLLGKFFQQKTYAFLSFERDYKSYFPIAITRIVNGKEEVAQVSDIIKGDRILVRHQEILPADGILLKGTAQIDYSFVTGESDAVEKQSGENVFAGGKQLGAAIEVEVIKSVSQSYLTQLWGNAAFNENDSKFRTLTDSIGKRFTFGVLTIAIIATLFWLFTDADKAMNVFTAVLIIACPCAIALAAPFTLGNMLRIFGQRKFYLKNTETVERLAALDMAIFDKTGTLTTGQKQVAKYEGVDLTNAEESLLKNTLRSSNHPLSRTLYTMLKTHDILTLDEYQEHLGRGITAATASNRIKIGSAAFVGGLPDSRNTAVYISTNNNYKGKYVFRNQYRKSVRNLFNAMQNTMELAILSGDNSNESGRLQKLLPKGTPLYFDQKPEDKLLFIKKEQEKGKKIMMVGDGLNDAGALVQSNVGIAISENINVFSPACDGILDASKFSELYNYIKASKKAMTVIKLSFVFSLLYNAVGLYFAVTGQLKPVIAAILMPLSSISIVLFTTLATNYIGRKLQ